MNFTPFTRQIITGLIAAALSVGMASAQDTPTFAGVIGTEVVITDGTTTEVIAAPDAMLIAPVVISPDGRYVGYFWYAQSSNLAVVDRQTGVVTEIAQNTAAGYPFSFTADSSAIVYAMLGASVGIREDGTAFVNMDVITQPLDGGAPTIVSTTSGIGCGGGASIPSLIQYGRETSALTGDSLTLAITPHGVVHSPNCAGRDLALLRPDGSVEMWNGVSRAVVSPDGNQAAALVLSDAGTPSLEILLIDLATGATRPLLVTATPDRLAWSADGTALYFSTQAFDTFVDVPEGALETARMFMGATQYERYAAILSQVDPETGVVTDLTSFEAWAIGQIIAADDAVYVTTIANLDAWLNAIADGSYDPMNDPMGEGMSTLVPVSVWRVPADGGEAALLIDHLHNAALMPG